MVKYYFFNGMRVAQRRGSSTITYLHGNHLGSTVLETSVIGITVNDEKYFAYGEQRDTGPVNTENQYTDQKRDDTGLYYYGARYYDPSLGTFVSPDMIVPEPTNVFDYNRMMYTRGNPLKYTDPSGNYVVKDDPDDTRWILSPTGSIGGGTGIEVWDELLVGTVKPPPNMSAILRSTLSQIELETLSVSVQFDEEGNPRIDFDVEQIQEIALLPLQSCAQLIGGVCGVSAGATYNQLGGGVRGSIDIFANADSEFSILFSPGGGGYTPVPGPVSRYTAIGIPDANLADLEGITAQFGLSGAMGPLGGVAELVLFENDDGRKFRGQAYGYAYAPGTTAEAHGSMTYSFLVYSSQR